ncbi:hypothetical protein [Mesorhizobium sp. CAU 1732]|uniref:hypothetical protein n=1 Tax=Mesorhizobium sp. CAU 1732 TaxID=3140358 RepID=UPI003261C34B
MRGGSWRPNCELLDDAVLEGFGESAVALSGSAVEVGPVGFAAVSGDVAGLIGSIEPVGLDPEGLALADVLVPADMDAAEVDVDGALLVGGTDGLLESGDAVADVSAVLADAFSASAFTRETSPGWRSIVTGSFSVFEWRVRGVLTMRSFLRNDVTGIRCLCYLGTSFDLKRSCGAEKGEFATKPGHQPKAGA